MEAARTMVTKSNNIRRHVILLFFLWKISRNDAEKPVSLIFGGDVTFGGVVKYMVDRGKCTYKESLQHLKPHLKDADFVVVNFETAVRDGDGEVPKPPDTPGIHLVSDIKALESLTNVGIKYVGLSNNHVNDFGEKQLKTTMELLRRTGIKYFGITEQANKLQTPLILKKHGIKIGLLGYREKVYDEEMVKRNITSARLDVPVVIRQVNALRKEGCDIVILFMHWGLEYAGTVDTPIFAFIKEIMEKSPVDVIVGSHPHVTQQHFYLNKTLVAPSLGNLLFPSHYSCSRNFETADRNITNLDRYVKVWAKQSILLKNPSSYGRLLKIQVNRKGLIPSSAKYLKTRILPNKENHCMVVIKEPHTEWKAVCEANDEECMGTSDCNVLHCDGIDAFPDL